MTKKRSPQEIKAIAYALADEIETRADAIQQRKPQLTYAACQTLALLEMVK